VSATSNPKASGEIPVQVYGMRRRISATLVDGLIIFFLTGIVSVLLSILIMIGSSYGDNEDLPFNLIFTGAGVLISLLYYVGFWAKSGSTIAKDVLGIQIIGTDGSIPSVGKALLRYIGYIVSAVVLSLGFLWVAFDERRQGLHDKIAGTYVVDAGVAFEPGDNVRFYHSDPDRDWLWLIIWAVIAIGAPGALLVSLWPLGGSVNRVITDFLRTLV
jgi:uncharacterized RDD family membrane protein YckC